MIGGTCQAVWCWHRLSPDSRPVTHSKVRKEAIQLTVTVLFAGAAHRETPGASKNFVQMYRWSLSSGSPGLSVQSSQSTINTVFLILIENLLMQKWGALMKKGHIQAGRCAKSCPRLLKDMQQILYWILNWIIKRNCFNWALKLGFKNSRLVSFCHVLSKSADCEIKYKWRFLWFLQKMSRELCFYPNRSAT